MSQRSDWCQRGHHKGKGRCHQCKREGRMPVPSEKQRDDRIFRIYRITREVYEQMLTDQGGVCKICKRPPLNRQLAVDHDHDTGAVRGLLCTRCNTALGWFETRAMEVADYLFVLHEKKEG